MEDVKVLRQLQRKALLVNLFGRLAILSDDDGREFDSLMERIQKRVDYYESLNMAFGKASHQACTITPRENDVLQYLLKGYRTLDIAQELKMAVNTVNIHINKLHSKFKVDSRVQLILKAKDSSPIVAKRSSRQAI